MPPRKYHLAATALLLILLIWPWLPKSTEPDPPTNPSPSQAPVVGQTGGPPPLHPASAKTALAPASPKKLRPAAAAPSPAVAPHVKGEFLITVRQDVPEQRLQDILTANSLRITDEYTLLAKKSGHRTLHVRCSDPNSPLAADDLLRFDEFADVSLNYIMEAMQTSGPVTPADPEFKSQWSLKNASDIDIDAPEAWAVTPADQEVVVAVIDTGIDYRHPDLAAAIWNNPLELPGDGNGDSYPGLAGVDDDGDGLIDEDSKGHGRFLPDGVTPNPLYLNDLAADDDENGYADDFHGIDTGDNDSDPLDTLAAPYVAGHGTHIAGIIAASHNALGIAGIAPGAKIMAIKGFQSSTGQLTSASELKGLNYILAMKEHGVNIVAINASYGCKKCNNPAQEQALALVVDGGILFAAAAGNNGTNNDTDPVYPASYKLANVLSVASTTDRDALDVSNYGRTTVHLGAPGKNIVSTDLTSPTSPDTLTYRSGTSMATAQVSGAIAVLAAVYPFESASQRWLRIMDGTDPVTSLAAKTISGGRLNLFNALAAKQTCVGDTRGDNDVDGLDLALFANGGTVFTVQDIVAGFGSACQ